jgi:microcystin-dependent protein
MPRYPEYQIHDLDTYGYGRIIQTIDGKFYDGWGNTVVFTLFGQEVSINVEGVKEDSTDGGNVNVTNTNTNNKNLIQDLQDQIDELTTMVNNNSINTVPVGTIVMWGGSSNFLPNGWILCDGRILEKNNSVELRQQLIDQNYPFGNSSTTMGTQGEVFDPKIPDLRERFVVGAGGSYTVGNSGGFNLIQTAMRDKTALILTTNSINCTFVSATVNGSAANLTPNGSNVHINSGIYEIFTVGFPSPTNVNITISYNCSANCTVYIETYSSSVYLKTTEGTKDVSNLSIYSRPSNSGAEYISVKIKTSVPVTITNIKITMTNPGLNSSTTTRVYSVNNITTSASSPSQENYISNVENRPPYYAICYIIKSMNLKLDFSKK